MPSSLSARRFPRVICCEQDAERAQLCLDVYADIAGFQGHFPTAPILPGVVQIDWASHFAATVLGQRDPVLSVDRLKFTKPILPDSEVYLSLRYCARANTTEFRFFEIDADKVEWVCSQGRLHHAQVTSA